jgi:hypothetical protein
MAGFVKLLRTFVGDCFRSQAQLKAENTILRHQLNVLQRTIEKRSRLSGRDRVLYVWLHVERIIGSIRCECLDHVIVRDVGHLRPVPEAYSLFSGAARIHFSLGRDPPIRQPVQHRGRIVATDVPGGLHHQYVFDKNTRGLGSIVCRRGRRTANLEKCFAS